MRFCVTRTAGAFSFRRNCTVWTTEASIFPVRGPLNVPRSPQGRPVIVQAGGSEDMIRVAAEFAEVIFCAPLNVEQGRTFYADLKERMKKHGRSPDEMKIMPGLSAVVGRTPAEAEEKQRDLDE